ncbi:MAG: 50S ribosomal protein L5 [bacterium JZ-2024 1]
MKGKPKKEPQNEVVKETMEPQTEVVKETTEPQTEVVKETTERVFPRLLEKYRREVFPELVRRKGYRNPMQVPTIKKVTISMGIGEAHQNSRALESGLITLSLISGQKPVVTRAKKSIAGFHLRRGMSVGAFVTLRGKRMWYFLDRLIHVVLPRFRDFRGLSVSSFDGRGNFNIGVREQTTFPEVPFEKIDKPRGMNIAITTTARTDEEAGLLLSLLGFPLKEEEEA